MSIKCDYEDVNRPELYDLLWIDMEVELSQANLEPKYKRAVLGEFRAAKDAAIIFAKRCRDLESFEVCVEMIKPMSERLMTIMQTARAAQSHFEREQAELQTKVAGTGRKDRRVADITETLYQTPSSAELRYCLLHSRQEHAGDIPLSSRLSTIKAVSADLAKEELRSERIDTRVKIATNQTINRRYVLGTHVAAFSEELAENVRDCSKTELRATYRPNPLSTCAKKIEACIFESTTRESTPNLYLQEKGALAPLAANLAAMEEPSFFTGFIERSNLTQRALGHMEIPPELRIGAHMQLARGVRHCYDTGTAEDRKVDSGK